jgi:hypothetical protein
MSRFRGAPMAAEGHGYFSAKPSHDSPHPFRHILVCDYTPLTVTVEGITPGRVDALD